MAINELKLEWSVWCAASLGDEYLEQIEEKHKPKPVHIPEFEEFKHSMQEPQTADELSALKLLV